MSWTSSLLFALQYGLYRHQIDYDEVDLSQVLLFVLDTRDFPRGTFVKDVEIIKVFASHPTGSELKNLKHCSSYVRARFVMAGHDALENISRRED